MFAVLGVTLGFILFDILFKPYLEKLKGENDDDETRN